jgi:hypothetical protein
MTAQSVSPRKIFLASFAALLGALLILFIAVLPSEYGWDPLGTGRALGLTGLSGEEQPLVLQAQDQAFKRDSVSFQLAPFESVEYAYRMEEGAALVFSWRASGEVLYNLHSSPDGMAPDYAESFARDRALEHAGGYTAPFPGFHGWYFQNRSEQDITLQFNSAGFYEYAEESNESGAVRRDFTAEGDQP